MDSETLYELVVDAVKQSLREEAGGGDTPIHARMVGGRILFEDNQGRQFKEVQAEALFRKVTSVREKLRVLEQKVNNHKKLDAADKAELQTYLTRCYGSLTTFNFLFAEESDRFRGSGS